MMKNKMKKVLNKNVQTLIKRILNKNKLMINKKRRKKKRKRKKNQIKIKSNLNNKQAVKSFQIKNISQKTYKVK